MTREFFLGLRQLLLFGGLIRPFGWIAAVAGLLVLQGAEPRGAVQGFVSATAASAGLPNLAPQNVVLSTYGALPGDLISVSWTMTNSGDGYAFATFTEVRLGASPTVPPSSSPVDLTFATRDLQGKSAVQQTVSVTLPTGIPLGTYYLWVFADAYGGSGQVVTADDAAPSAGLAIQAVRGQPNLQPLNVALGAGIVRPGDPLAVAWTLTNSGSVTCPPSYTGLHLGAAGSTAPAGSGLVLPTPAIPARSAIRLTNVVTIPPATPYGSYVVWVVADDVADSTLNQSSRTDDAAASAPFTVAASLAQPNLVPLNVVLGSYSARPGDTLTVIWTLTNTGSGNCPASFTGLHLGDSGAVPPLSDGLDLKISTPPIPAGAAVRLTNLVTLPAGAAFGNYFIWVVADDVDNSTLNQTTRADDASRSDVLILAPVALRPNLVPQDIRLGAYSVKPGDLLQVAWTIANVGDGHCAASYTGLRLWTSASGLSGSEVLAIQLPTPGISAHSSVRQTNTVTIPADATPGNYYIWVVADDQVQSTLDQTSRDDDAAPSGLLGVSLVPGQPNLAPQNVVLDRLFVRLGDSLTVTWTLTNSGSVTCPVSLTGLRLGQSATNAPANPTLRIPIATPEIPAGASIQQTNTFVVPTNAPLGTNYLWVVADDLAASTLNQSSREDDAAGSGPVVVVTELPQPNLVPASVTLNTSVAQPGAQLLVSWIMKNAGTADCPASTTGIHLGTSATTPPSSNSLSLGIATPAIAAQSSVTQSNSFLLPADLPVGVYYLWVIADDVPNSGLNQSSTADDAAPSGGVAVIPATPRPNLVPSAITLSAGAAAPGGRLTMAWTMSNSGNGDCPASTTGLHLGTSASVPPTSDSLNLKIATPAIPAQSSLRQTNQVVIPANTPMGRYYLWVVADDAVSSSLNQTSKADDAAPSGVLVISLVILTGPAPGDTVAAPPFFGWNVPILPPTTLYLANKAAPVFGTDPVVFLDAEPASPAGTNALQLTVADWTAAVARLGVAQDYYWTIGSIDPAQRQVYAEWQPFRSRPLLTVTNIVATPGGSLRVLVVAPNQTSVVLQSSETLTNWTDRSTLQNTAGAVPFTGDSPGNGKRFYRTR